MARRLMKNLSSFNPQFYGYDPKRDGTLAEYFKIHDGHSSFPLFRGYKMFKRLRDEAWLLPDFSTVRLMWNVGRGDEYFGVNEDYFLIGLEANFHSGRPGVHDPLVVLGARGAPMWEVNHIVIPEIEEMVQNAKDALCVWKAKQSK